MKVMNKISKRTSYKKWSRAETLASLLEQDRYSTMKWNRGTLTSRMRRVNSFILWSQNWICTEEHLLKQKPSKSIMLLMAMTVINWYTTPWSFRWSTWVYKEVYARCLHMDRRGLERHTPSKVLWLELVMIYSKGNRPTRKILMEVLASL